MTLNSAWDLQKALWQKLKINADLLAVLGGPYIYDDVPQSTGFPFVTIGEIRTNDWSTQTSRGHEHFMTLHAWSRSKGRKEIQAIMNVLDEILEEPDLSLENHNLVNFSLVFWDARRDSDGKTYQGLMRFRAVTER